MGPGTTLVKLYLSIFASSKTVSTDLKATRSKSWKINESDSDTREIARDFV